MPLPTSRSWRYAEVYRSDLGQSTILRTVSPEFHAAVMETGGFEAFKRSSALEKTRQNLEQFDGFRKNMEK